MPLVRTVANVFIAILLVVMGVACIGTAALQLIQGHMLADQRKQSAAFTHCTAEWQADFLKAFEARSEANLAVTAAMDAIVKAVANQDSDAFRTAVRHYQAVREQQIEERVKNPLPPLPEVRCGK